MKVMTKIKIVRMMRRVMMNSSRMMLRRVMMNSSKMMMRMTIISLPIIVKMASF